MPMPRDSEMLTPLSRALLRAARAGCTYIRAPDRAATEDEMMRDDRETDADDSAITGTVGAGAATTTGTSSSTTTAAAAPAAAAPAAGNVGLGQFERKFSAGKWLSIPRHLEPPEIEFLAKRRAGLTAYGAAAVVNADAQTGEVSFQVQLRRARFKKFEPATGAMIVYDALVPEGYTVEGEVPITAEVKSEEGEKVTFAKLSAGAIVEGVGVVGEDGLVVARTDETLVNSAPKRRVPPPKRKTKGPGRGKKKKVMFAPPGAATTTNGDEASKTPKEAPGTHHEEDEDDDESDDDEDNDAVTTTTGASDAQSSAEKKDVGADEPPKDGDAPDPEPMQGVQSASAPDKKSQSSEQDLDKVVAPGSKDREDAHPEPTTTPSQPTAAEESTAPEHSGKQVEHIDLTTSGTERPLETTESPTLATDSKPNLETADTLQPSSKPPSPSPAGNPAPAVTATATADALSGSADASAAGQQKDSRSPVRFEDGEIDLLGSHEAGHGPAGETEQGSQGDEKEAKSGGQEQSEAYVIGDRAGDPETTQEKGEGQGEQPKAEEEEGGEKTADPSSTQAEDAIATADGKGGSTTTTKDEDTKAEAKAEAEAEAGAADVAAAGPGTQEAEIEKAAEPTPEPPSQKDTAGE